MSISIEVVKALRARTGVSVGECKKALVEVDGDLEAAVDHLRRIAGVKAARRLDRVVSEGQVAVASGDGFAFAVRLSCETDFVARTPDFQALLDKLVEYISANQPTLEDLGQAESIETARTEFSSTCGEKISIDGLVYAKGERVGTYRHGTQLGTVVALNGGDQKLAEDLAMHVAASNPIAVSRDSLPQDVVERERQLHEAATADMNKPANILEKIIDGRMSKFYQDVCLVDQTFIRDDSTKVGDLVKKAGASVAEFARLKVGEQSPQKED